MGFFTNSALFSNRLRQLCLGLLLMLGALLPNHLSASHAAGGDISYEILSGNRIRVRVSFYRDCTGIPAPNPITVNVVGFGCNGLNVNTALQCTLTAPGREVTQVCPSQLGNSACNGGTLPGLEVYEYEGIVTIPNWDCGQIRLSIDESARNPVDNINGGNLFVPARIYPRRFIGFPPSNNAPTFSSPPVPFVCVGQQFLYNHGASDADGDTLRYYLDTARTSNDVTLGYVNPHTPQQPLPTTGPFRFCEETGQIAFIASAAGTYTVVVRIDEIRNGVVISSTTRDMQVQVINCGSGNNPVVIDSLDFNNLFPIPPGVIDTLPNTTCPAFANLNQYTGTQFTMCALDSFDFAVFLHDDDVAQNLTVLSDLPSVIPGSTVDLLPWSNPGEYIIAVHVGPVPRTSTFRIEVKDDNCLIPSRSIIGFTIYTNSVSIQAPDVQRLCARIPLPQVVPLTTRAVSRSSAVPVYSWRQISGSPVTLSSNNQANTTITVPPFRLENDPAVIVVDLSDGQCAASDTIRLEFDNYPTTIAGSSAACAGIAGTWSASASFNGVAINDPNRYTSSTVANTTCALLPTPGATNVALTDDSSTPAIPIGFPFTFYGTTFNSAFIGSNGFITFGAGSSSLGNVQLPSAGAPDNLIALAWDDWNPAQGGTISHTTVGTAPNRQFIVTFDGVPRFGQGTTPALTGQIILYEATSCFDIRLITAISNSDVTWAGYQNSDGTAGGGTLLSAPVNENCPPIVTVCPVATSFNWFTGTGTPISTTPSPSVSYAFPTTGTQQLIACLADATLTNGCITCDTISVNVSAGLSAPTLTNCTPGLGQVVFQVGATDVNSTGLEWRPCGGVGAWTPLAAGVNTITVTGLGSSSVGCAEVRSIGFNGVPCDNVPVQVTCTSLPCYTVTETHVDATCFGVSNGQINITVTGYAGSLRIRRPGAPDLINQQSPITISGLAGSPITPSSNGTLYPITITDGINCSTTLNVTLTSPPALAVTVTAGQATCGNNGTLSSTVTGGVGPYSYNWANATGCTYTTSATNAACPGNYILTVTDANGCTFNSAVVNVVAAATTMVAGPVSPRVCGGVANTQTQVYNTTVTGTTNGTYQWTQLSGAASTLSNATASSNTVTLPSNLDVAGTPVFQVVYTHSGACAITATVSVDVDFQTVSASVSDATVCAGQTITLSSALSNPRPNVTPSTALYTVTSVTYASVTPVAPINCTLTGGSNDDGFSQVNIGFPFTFFGTTYTQAFVGTNGFLSFGQGYGAGSWVNNTLPNTVGFGDPNNAIYLVWGDLLASAGSMRYEVLGTAPNRRFVLYFSNEDLNNNNVPQEGQIILYEGTNEFDIVNIDIDYGDDAVQGVENIDGTYALPVPGRNLTTFTSRGQTFRYSYGSVTAFPPPTYAWATSTGTPVGNTQNVTTTQNNATTYVVTVNYAGSCAYTASVTVNMGNTVTAPVVSCGLRTANSAEFLATTPVGATGMEYSLNNGLTWNNYTGSFVNGGLTPGQCATLLARGTSSNADDCVFTVSAPAVCCAVNCFPFSTTTTPVSCVGSTNGGITVTPQGVTTTVTYDLVSSGSSVIVATNTTGEFSGLAAGPYRVSLTDTNGCVDFADVTVTQPSAISLTTSTSIATCDCNATAGVTATGGTGPYTYAWSNGATTSTITGLCSGISVDVTITDALGCTAVSTAVTITGSQPDLVSLTAPELCLGQVTTLSASWINGGVNACTTVTNVCAGTASSLPYGDYSNLLNLTATDGNPLRRDVNDARMQILYTASDLRYMGVGSHKLTNLGFNVSRKQSTAPTNWTIKLTCVAPTVTQVGSTWINTSAGSTVFSGNVTTTAGYNFLGFDNHYVWDGTSNLVVEICTDNSATNLTDELEGSILTQQRVLFATDNTSLGCISNTVVPTATFQAPNFNFGMCLDNATYTWQAPDGTISAPLNSTLYPITPTQSGTYTVTVNVNGCERVTTTFVTVNTPIAAPTVSCGNATSNSLEFTWNTPAGATAFEISTGAAGPWTPTNNSSANFTGLTPLSSMTLYVRAANVPLGCTNLIGQQTCTTTNCTSVTTTSTAPNCFGGNDGTITATALTAGNFTFALFDGTTQVGATQSASPAVFTGLTAGSAYTVRFTDLTNVCSATYAVTVTQPTQLVANPSKTDETCYLALNGTATVVASNGTAPYSITWSTNVDAAQRNSFTVSGLTGDTYTAVVNDANGCTVATGVTVNGPTQPIDVTFSTVPPTCLGATNGTASATVTGAQGAVNYVWTPANANSANISNVVQGPLSVVVTDANGCTNTFAATVATPAAITATVTTTPACSGLNNATAAATFGNYTGAVTYSWNVGGTTASIANLAPNTNVIVTVNSGTGCTATATANTGAATLYAATVTSVQAPSCNTGASDGILAASFTTPGAVASSYVWSMGVTTVNSAPLSPGQNASVTITATNGCVATATGTALAAVQNLTATVTPNSPTCAGSSDGSAVVTTNYTGATALSYTWTGNTSNTATSNGYAVNAVAAVTVGAPFGCVATASTTVTYGYTDIVPFTVQPTSNRPSCSYALDGSALATVSVTRGSGYTFNYAWTPSSANQPGINGLAGGTPVSVVVSIVGIAGCDVVTTTSVPNTPVLTVPTPSLVGAAPCSDNQRLAVLTTAANGGNGTYTYIWSNGVTSTDATGLTAGTYAITVTDQLGCTASSSVTINSILTPTADIHYNGSATSAVSAASPGIDFSVPMTASSGQQVSTTYTWASNSSEGILTNTNGFNVQAYGTNTAGIITVTYSVTASNTGCTATDDIEVEYILPSIQFANIFTPNNDSNNDTFGPIIVGAQIQLVSFTVYNRWGAIVYQTTDRNSLQWDGRYQGEDCPRDMYVFQLRYIDAGRTVETVTTGEVNLIR